MDSEIIFFTDSNYDEFANEILFVGDIFQRFQFESVFTAAEIQAKNDFAGTSALSLTGFYVTEIDTQSAH